MRPDLHADISRQLLADFAFKTRGEWLREGKCPDCGKKELYTRADTPWVLRCGRVNKCGAQLHIKDLYRDLFDNWSERYRSTDAAPAAAADAYLQYGRGFDLQRLRGLYTQESYYSAELRQASATVRFTLDNGTWWERIIDKPERFGKRKANFAPGKPYQGRWWQMPDSPADAGELWLTEGVFDTIALELAGVASRALLTCHNYPEQALAELAAACDAAGRKRPKLVWALDDGPAGTSCMRKFSARAREAGWVSSAAYLPSHNGRKFDWNELHQLDRLDSKTLDDARYHGDLLLARSAADKALLMYKRKGRAEFHFGFDSRLYWFKYDDARYAKALEALAAKNDDLELTDDEIREKALTDSASVSEIANCYPTALYYQHNALTDDSWYYYRITFPHGGRPIKNTFTAAQLSSGTEFKKRLMGIAPGALYTGSTGQLDSIFRDSLYGIKTVETVDFVGYSKEHGCYVFGDRLAMREGTLVEANDEDYFEFGKLSIKTLNQSVALQINSAADEYSTEWVDMLWRCYGAKGLVALAFWFGCLFAEQIRADQKSYPFMEVVGEAGSGKSTLIEFLWKLFGRRDYEGFDPSKATMAARARNFAQVSNLPVVLIESDRDTDTAKQKAFDWDELKTAYNGRSVRATGVKNNGNETREPPFRGAIVISQNAAVNASDAILQRIIHLHFTKGGHTQETKELAERLERMPVEQVSGFILAATKREARILRTIAEQKPAYEDAILARKEIKSVRVAKNHAQLMAIVDALRHVVKLTDQQHAAVFGEIERMALERQRAITMDHPFVQAFWELFDHLEYRLGQNEDSLNHSRDDALIAVNLLEMEERARKRGLHMPAELTDLKKHLRTSRWRRFEDAKSVNSRITYNTRKCWVFKREKTDTD